MTLTILFGSVSLASLKAAGPTPLPPLLLWPQGAPGDTEPLGPEADTSKPTDRHVAGKPVIRVGNVSQPALSVYLAPSDKRTGAAVVICPGGGYHILAMDLEGTEVAEWLNSIGVTAIVLKYRVPARKGRPRHAAPLQDLQRAVGLARQHASDWGIDPRRIGVMGFSAGAHLSAVLSCNFEQRTYEPLDAADQLSCRPDFVMLIYPAYLTVAKEDDKLAPELPVGPRTPPTFLVQTQDDGIRVECSLFYYLALKQAKVPAEMHLYASGGHGYGLRPTSDAVTTWPKRAEQWMRGLKVLEPSR
ncbi:MAG: alpha/beta hydrolase [Verrucomicrobia bacterium]|nr:alpha/beta hydrolase [Verrucomicrobiota bacterium]